MVKTEDMTTNNPVIVKLTQKVENLNFLQDKLEVTIAEMIQQAIKQPKPRAPRPPVIKEQCTNPEDSSSNRKEKNFPHPPTRTVNNGHLCSTKGNSTSVGRTRPLTGTGASDEDLRAAGRTAWLYVGRLRQETTPEAVKRFLDRKGVIGDIVCEELTTLGSIKSYKIGIPFSFLDTTTDKRLLASRDSREVLSFLPEKIRDIPRIDHTAHTRAQQPS